jgi:hypothetical protein
MLPKPGRSAPRRATLPLAALVALALGGCTITTYSSPPPPQAYPPSAAQTAAAKPTPAKPSVQPTTPRRPAAPRTPTAPPAPTDTSQAPRITQTILFGNGKTGPLRGLAYVIPPDTKTMPDLSQLVPFATMFTDRLEIQSQLFTGGFPGALAQEEWFAIRYEGNFEIPRDGAWGFKVESDDGAILYVDGVKTVDNDGRHEARVMYGARGLKAGKHRIQVDYFQATGPVALTVQLVDKNIELPLIGVR